MNDIPAQLSASKERRKFLVRAGIGFGLLSFASPLMALQRLESCASENGSTTPLPTFRFVVKDPAFVYSRPCFSPSGLNILFMRAPATMNPQLVANSNLSPWSLWTVPASGGKQKRFFQHEKIRATRPDWCRDNLGTVAFTGIADDGGAELYLVDKRGENLTHIPLGNPPLRSLHYPSWYPHGEALAVTDYAKHQVLKVDIKSGTSEVLSDPAEVWAGMCSVSPDSANGNPLAFAGQRPARIYEPGRNRIWIKYSAAKAYPLDEDLGRMPQWSPDGTKIVFASTRRRTAPTFALHRRSLPGGKNALYVKKGRAPEERITDPVVVSPFDYTCLHAKWSPDGTRLVCTAASAYGSERGIAIVDIGGQQP